ncbi:protein artemis-like [Ruditapes philippinarum]|uniref:protein artemis-like n=1 Tax=Ruditapes philippinarum TaxID=129788 RepID=UPI00295C057C|nr:protein artemis-like [Ruditapes philippinarum]XP_060590087.1 protein artemis-like [Ruditapes philippinarum]
MSKMSCFGGRMQEYDRISLDRFDGRNLQSTVYFLSHLHEDHTAGLAEKIFCKRLKSNKDIFLYCSEVTQVLLVASKKYRHLKPYIKGLSINTPTTLDIPDPLFEEKEKITVTLLPAFHCPGSVMFLIEGAEGTVLYTGDFRWEHFNIEQMHHLQSGESVKKIKSLYVDTTFCSPENLYIPSRQQCIDAVCQLVHEWTSISPKHIVNIYLRAQFGHEPLLNAVASRLNKKVHVNNHKFGIYNRIQEFHGNFTSDGLNTQLHACDKNCMIEVDGEEVLCSETHDADKVLAILPTTMYFTQFSHLTLDKIIKKINSNFFRACYSFHSSYTEVKDLISYLKPERVFPNVKPPSDSSLAVTQHRLNTMLKECMETGAGEIIQEQEVKELGTLKTRSGRQINKRKERESTSDAESLDFGTPVKSAKLSSLEAGEPVSPASSTSTKKGRGRGRGKGKTETVSQPGVGTRRSTRRSAATSSPQNTTPKKLKKSERSPTPDLFLTPVSDSIDQQSSFCGSERSDSELSLFSSQKSIDLPVSADTGSSWTAGSFLAAVSSSSEDDTGAGRCCMFDDEEQTDEHFEDRCLFTDTEEEDLTSKESVSPQDDVDTDHNQALNKPKGKTESPVHTKRGRRGMKIKTVSAKDDICIEQGQTIDDDKDQVDEKSSKLKDKEKDHTDVRNNDKTLQSESVLNIDSTLEKEYYDKDGRLNQSDSSIVQGERDNIDTLSDKNSLLTEATNTSYATKYVEDVKGEEARSKGLSQEHEDIVSELQLHLSESTPGSDQDFVATKVDTVGEEIVFIDSSDSEDEVTNVDQDNDCIKNIKTVSKSETESNVEKVSSPMRSNSPSALEDKSQAQSKGMMLLK